MARPVRKKRELTSVEPKSKAISVVSTPSSSTVEFTPLQILVVQGLARGYLLHELARKYQHHLVPHESDRTRRLKKARTRLRAWMRTQKFRDLLWEETMVGLDIDSPLIVKGIARKAKAGRVDAARLAFELNGRHAPHTEVQPAQVNIVLGDIPRPTREVPHKEKMDLDEVIDEAEWEPA